MSASLFQLMSHASCLKSNANTDVDHKLCGKEQILIVAQQILSCLPKAFANVAKNGSNFSRLVIFFQIEGQIKIELAFYVKTQLDPLAICLLDSIEVEER